MVRDDRLARVRQAAFRFTVYGSIMVFGEVVFYTITRVGRVLPGWVSWLFQYQWLIDARLDLGHIWATPIRALYGQASLWMLPVYGSIGLFGIEPVYRRVRGWLWPLRGALYMLIILSMECLWGWILRWITGYDIWYYEGPLTILRYTSLAIAPMWFIVGFFSEGIVRLVGRSGRSGHVEKLGSDLDRLTGDAPDGADTSPALFGGQHPIVDDDRS